MAEVPQFRPDVLREYALLAGGERGSLTGPLGGIVWMCVPGRDSDAVFSALIGDVDAYAISPSYPWYVWGGYYAEGTLTWHSRRMTSAGAVECREALAFPRGPHTAVVLRRVQAVDGEAEVRVVLDPRAGFGRQTLRKPATADGVRTGLAGPLHLRWCGAQVARQDDGALTCTLTVPAGSTHDLVLELPDRPLAARPVPADRLWEATEHSWHRSMPEPGAVIDRRDARHAHAVLRGMTSGTGGMLAATTSLPERAESGRNYDYRYTWIRDQCYAGQAVAGGGAHPLLDDAVVFIAERLLADGPDLRPAYPLVGWEVPDEHPLLGLRGYPGGGHRIGNKVSRQFQLDAFGEALLLFAAAARHDRLDTVHWRAAETAIEKRWGEAGAGVWELAPEHWAHSRLICAAGLRAATAQASSWTSPADAIVAETTRDCLHHSGRWQRFPSDPGVDATLLLPAVRGPYRPVIRAASRLSTRSAANGPRTATSTGTGTTGVRFTRPRGLPALRVRHRTGHPPARPHDGGESVVRAQSGRVRSRRAALGGVRRQPAAAAGQHPQALVHALLLETACRLSRPWEAG